MPLTQVSEREALNDLQETLNSPGWTTALRLIGSDLVKRRSRILNLNFDGPSLREEILAIKVIKATVKSLYVEAGMNYSPSIEGLTD